jgi:Deoxyhypusine synthase
MNTVYQVQPLTLGDIATYPLASRKSKVSIADFAKPVTKNVSFANFLQSLPRILAAGDFRGVVDAIQQAKREGRTILWGIGGHVIKTGLGPLLADLMRRGFISAIAMNGAALIHDFEIALAGQTSEDVEAGISKGKFGMSMETGLFLNQIASSASFSGIGYGEAAGKFLTGRRLLQQNVQASVLCNAYNLRIPVTVHLAIGTDIPHMHPAADGATLGAATHHDFRLFCGLVKQMHPGGIYLNWGSAVVLPEIFLKAVSVARNLGVALRPITTANFDFIQHYRPLQNVVKRPTAPSDRGRSDSKGYAITGHHEILFPLVAAALASGWPRSQSGTQPKSRLNQKRAARKSK